MSDTGPQSGPQFAVCNVEWELAETSLLKVLHFHLDRECAGNQPSAVYRVFTRQKTLLSLIDSFVVTGLLYQQTSEHQSLLCYVEQSTGCIAEQKQAVQPVEQNSSDNGAAGIDRDRYGSGGINEGTSNDLAEGHSQCKAETCKHSSS